MKMKMTGKTKAAMMRVADGGDDDEDDGASPHGGADAGGCLR